MPESSKKNGSRKPSVSVPKPEQSGDALKDETGLYGDEADIPLRRGRKKAAKKGGKSSGSGKKKSGKRRGFFSLPAPGGGKKKKKKKSNTGHKVYRSFYDILSATGSDSLFKPLKLFGREIRFWPLFLLGIIVLLSVGVMLNNSNLAVKEQTITIVGLPEELEGYRIVVMSDLNGRRFGDSQSLLLRTINNLSYNAIYCLGDMVGKGGDPEPFYEFLEGLRRPERVYFICGDSDPGPFVSKPRSITGTLSQIVLEDWILGAIERGANYVDAPVCISLKSSNLWLTPATMLNLETVSTMESWATQTEAEEDGVLSGVESDYNTLPMTDYRYQLMQKLYDAERTMTSSDIHISLAHERPADAFIYTSEDHDAEERYLRTPELILAGHYCNGVWQLPFIGAIYVPDKTLPRGGWFPDSSAISGLSSVEDTQVFITGGMSTNGSVPLMPFRLFNGPEITVITLTSRLPENMLEAN